MTATCHEPPAEASPDDTARARVLLADPAARQAWVNLARAAQRHPPPCAAEPEAWWAPDAETREYAASVCRAACPHRDLCRDFARLNAEPYGVWGGVDRTPRRGPT